MSASLEILVQYVQNPFYHKLDTHARLFTVSSPLYNDKLHLSEIVLRLPQLARHNIF